MPGPGDREPGSDPGRAGPPVLTVYSRPGCHLCEEFIAELIPLCRGRARLVVEDVDRDPALREAYGLRIPVLCTRGREICAVSVNHEAIRAALAW
jgi:hypothetical protein